MSSIAAAEQTKVVSHQEWLAARKDFLAKEKEFTRLRDELSRKRRELPWKRSKRIHLRRPNGKQTLADLFAGRSQLVVYHFMLARGGAKAAKAARISPTILMAWRFTLPTAMSHSQPSPTHHSRD